MTKGNSNKTSNKVMLSQKVKINDESATKDEKIDQSLAFVHVSAEEMD